VTASTSRREALRDGAATLGCALTDQQTDRLLAYVALLAKWSRVYNLTAVRDPDRIVVQHVLDSLSLVAPLSRETGTESSFNLLDVGSGAGLPGLVVAAALDRATVTCVDASAKKAGFVRQAAAELGLQNLKVEHARVEDLRAAPFRVVTARAFASLPDLVAATRRHLGGRGVWAAMKGRTPDNDISALPVDVEAFHVEPLRVPGLDAERCLVWMRPKR